MAEHTHVVPANLRAAADHHRQTSQYLRGIPATHAELQQSLDSLGPIFAGLAQAGAELLEQRRECYQRQADAHADTAEQLLATARLWQQQQHDAGARFDGIVDDQR